MDFEVGGLLYLLIISSTVYLGLFDLASQVFSYQKTLGRSALGIKQFAMPALQTSYPFSRAPVNPRQYPRLFRSLERKYPPQTSVKNPILHSGIAKRVFQVAIRQGEKTLKPTPPPITIPSQLEICRVFSLVNLQSRVNSSLKKSANNLGFVSRFQQSPFTSPPAQNALPPAPQIQNAFVQVLSLFNWALIQLIMGMLTELSALGLLRVTLAKFLYQSILTSFQLCFPATCCESMQSLLATLNISYIVYEEYSQIKLSVDVIVIPI